MRSRPPLVVVLAFLAAALALAVACDGGDGGGAPAPDVPAVVPDVPVAVPDVPIAVPDVPIAVPDVPVAAPDVPPDLGPPPLPEPAAPPPYSGGTCPALVAGRNTIESGGLARGVELYLPAAPVNAPVFFVWHGVGDTARNIAAFFQASSAARNDGVIVVAPHDLCASGHTALCNQLNVWGYEGGQTRRREADLALFDDLLSCLSAQYDVDPRRVWSAGFSAGGLWTTYLALHRSQYLAAAAILSGGTGAWVPYVAPEHRLPLLLVWGGETDVYMQGVVKFFEMMRALVGHAQEDGLFFVACDHGLGHTVPGGATTWIYRFLFDHPWNGESSPYLADGLPGAYPGYCAVQALPAGAK
jgi:dienelactone hydrolase